MKLTIIAACAAMSVTVGSAFATTYAEPYTSYFAFGDSLTDDGKFGPGGLAPPSFDGRFSNGLTYAEYIASDFEAQGKFTLNLALGGATAGEVNTNTPSYPTAALPFATFSSQVGVLQGLLSSPASALVGDDPLVSVLFGANDLFQNLFTNPNVATEAADAVMANIEDIAALGGQFDDFVVMNLPNLSLTPLFANTAAAPLAQATTVAFNMQLAANLELLRDQGLTITEVDQDSFLRGVLSDPSAFGITETEVACTPSLSTFTPLDNCAFDPATGQIDITLADSFLFVDDVHPNRVVQEAFADEVRAALTPVPLPASLPLLLVGLGGFGLMRRRRAA